MSKSLRSFPAEMRTAIARRRAQGKTPGNAYWGARDYLIAKGEIPAENRLPLPGKTMEEIVAGGISKIKGGLPNGSTRPTKRPTPGFSRNSIPSAAAGALRQARQQLISR